MKELIPIERIERKIYLIRGQKVMLDRDLAVLYGVKTKALLQGVRRNKKRFPEDFMFKLNEGEFKSLRSQFVTSNRGGRRYLPYVFTEQGIAMLSSILKSEKAIFVNVAIMRTFVKLRQIISNSSQLAKRFDELEKEVRSNTKEIRVVFDAIRLLITKPQKRRD